VVASDLFLVQLVIAGEVCWMRPFDGIAAANAELPLA
jgi:hypothetical protein